MTAERAVDAVLVKTAALSWPAATGERERFLPNLVLVTPDTEQGCCRCLKLADNRLLST